MKQRTKYSPVAAIAALGLAVWIAAAAPVLGQGGGAPKTTNGSVAFKVNCDRGIFDQEIRATLTVEKPGKTSLIDGAPGAGQVDGNHNFPRGTNAGGVGAYYKGLLINAGWKEGTDFKVEDGTINFFGISKLDAGSNHQHLVVEGSTDSKDVPYTPIPAPPEKKKASVIRKGATVDGALTLTGFGIHWSSGQPVSTSTSTVTTRFTAQDSADQILAKVCKTLVAAGWDAVINADGQLEIRKNGQGDYVYSLSHQVEYYPSATDETGNEDHWIFTLGDNPI